MRLDGHTGIRELRFQYVHLEVVVEIMGENGLIRPFSQCTNGTGETSLADGFANDEFALTGTGPGDSFD